MCKENSECRHYVCECGKSFERGCQLGGHQLGCPIHKAKLKEEQEKRRLPNGLFKCENPDCNKEHDGSYGSGRFCSEHCRRVYIGKHSIEKRKSNGTFKSWFVEHPGEGNHPKSPYGTWKCRLCETVFSTRAELRHHIDLMHPNDKSHAWNYGKTKETDIRLKEQGKQISETLKLGYKTGKIRTRTWTDDEKQAQSERAKSRKLGGYHRHGGRGKRGWYKGYWCDSSWELAYVIYNLEHGIHFVRNRVGFDYEYDGIIRKYYPDYILDDGSYVEVKGYEDRKAKVKHKSFISSGHTLNVIGKDEIKPYLKYAIEKYGNKFTDLYE